MNADDKIAVSILFFVTFCSLLNLHAKVNKILKKLNIDEKEGTK